MLALDRDAVRAPISALGTASPKQNIFLLGLRRTRIRRNALASSVAGVDAHMFLRLDGTRRSCRNAARHATSLLGSSGRQRRASGGSGLLHQCIRAVVVESTPATAIECWGCLAKARKADGEGPRATRRPARRAAAIRRDSTSSRPRRDSSGATAAPEAGEAGQRSFGASGGCRLEPSMASGWSGAGGRGWSTIMGQLCDENLPMRRGADLDC